MKNITKQKIIDSVCFVVGPMILVGFTTKELFGDGTFGAIGIGLIMAGVLNRLWKREK